MSEILMYAFEGLDGAGKTTNIKKLNQYFIAEGYNIATCVSPSRSPLGQFIRANLMNLDPWLKDRLFVLDIQHSLSNLSADVQLVLWDRYIDSIYTSNRETCLKDINILTRTLPKPHRTFLLDMSTAASWAREGQLSDHPLDLDWLRMKHQRYHELLSQEPGRFCKIDATSPPDDVFSDLVAQISNDALKCIIPSKYIVHSV